MTIIAENTPLCQVLYDRSAKLYNVRNGKLVGQFPTKTEAQWAAIEHDAPAVARIARQMLAAELSDESRLIKAARLVIEGQITDHLHDGDYTRAQVNASGDNRSPVTGWPHYQIVHNLKWTCDCYDYEAHAAAGSQHKCKHILAVMILQQMAADRREFEVAAARKQADRIERRATALPASVDNHDRLADMLGYDDALQTVTDQIAAARAQVPALKSQQPKARIGSLPTQWQYR